MRYATIILIIPLFFLWNDISGQQSNIRRKIISTYKDILLDSLSIIPGSVVIKETDTSLYTVDHINAQLSWKANIQADSVEIFYRVFPFRVNAVASKYAYDSIQNNFRAIPEFISNQPKQPPLLNFGNLNYNGSFGRSLSFGNSQDAVFNSQLNLQLNGFIGDSIEVNAAITDNNIPIQPEGTTQQLNEFDKVLLQFKKNNWSINLGDIDLRQDEQYFLRFYKRLQGIAYQQVFKKNNKVKDELLFSGAIAKGKFARNVFSGLEGNQGPYRLQGNNNELFFIVLAGTEKVFIDGVIMQRGEDADYVINYNTAEVIFTPKRLITKDSRIQVEFEYADRNYLNTMLYVSNKTIFNERFSLRVSAYSNADAKNSPLNQTLDNRQRQFLADIGDSIQRAFYPVADVDSFSVSKILYKKIDTLYNGVHDSVFVYSTNSDSAIYALNFIEVGAGNGNYIPLLNAANGKVFQWVQPVNGVPQGNFEAATFLVSPKKQQLIALSGEYVLNKNTSIKTELAYSSLDVNAFSSKQKNNDDGYAARVFIIRDDTLNTKHALVLNSVAGYEWVDKQFNPVERLRPVEFSRDWGLPILTQRANEQLPSLSMRLSDSAGNFVQYKFSGYLRSDGFKALRNEIYHQQVVNGFNITDGISFTTNKTPGDKGFYLRPAIDVSRALPSYNNYTIGAGYALEHNLSRNLLTDTLNGYSFSFETINAYLRSDAGKPNHWSFTYFTRQNKIPYKTDFLFSDRSHNYNLQAEWLQNPHHQFRLNATYRQLFVNSDAFVKLQPDKSLLARAEYLVSEWNGFLNGNVLYEIGSGQEQQRDFSYIEVPAATGQYAWIDYNADGIQQLNEFEFALFPDQAKYIRIYTPTNNYVKSDYIQFNYSIVLTPKALPANVLSDAIKNFLSKFVMQSSAQTFKKQLSGAGASYIPVKGNISDTNLITVNYLFNNTISYNRYSTVWGIDLTNITGYNKTLLTYGLETRTQNEWILKGRVNLAKVYTLSLEQKLTGTDLFTPSFINRNYALKAYNASPLLTYTNSTRYRIAVGYSFTHKENANLYGGEVSTMHSFNGEARYNAVNNTALTAHFTFSDIQYDGKENTTVSYIMLNGLLPGKNYLWGLELNKRLVNNLEINLNYEGRKPGDARTIHTGRASIRAIL